MTNKKRSKKQKESIADYVIHGNFVCAPPKREWEIIGKESLVRRILGYPFGSWDIVEIRRRRDPS